MDAAPTTTETGGSPRVPIALRRRPLLLGSVVALAALGVWIDRGEEPRAWLAGVAAVAVALVAARRGSGVGRALGWGAAIVLASVGARGGDRDLDAYMAVSGAIGAMTCAVAAAVAIRRIPVTGGVIRPARGSPGSAPAAIIVLWSVALLAFLLPSGRLSWLTESPRAWALGVSLATVAVLAVEAEWTLRRRRLELGAVERTVAMRTLIAGSLAIGVAAGLLGGAYLDALGRLIVALVSVLSAAVALDPDGARVARAARRAVVLAVSGTAVVGIGTVLAPRGGDDVREATLVTAAAALVVGVVAFAIDARMGTSRGPWVDAFARAAAAAGLPEPDDAIRDALLALRAPGGLSSASAELWTLAPPRATKIDAAGYLHDREAELPEGLVAVALREPEGTLRADLLRALEVRRPDLRPLSTWLEDRGIALAAVVSCGPEVEGVLLLARTARGAPETLEEVRALKRASPIDSAAACQARATRAHLLTRAP